MAVNRQAREGYKHALQNLLLHAKKGLPIHLVDVSESAYFECTAEVQQVQKIPIPSKAVLITTRETRNKTCFTPWSHCNHVAMSCCINECMVLHPIYLPSRQVTHRMRISAVHYSSNKDMTGIPLPEKLEHFTRSSSPTPKYLLTPVCTANYTMKYPNARDGKSNL